MIRIETERTLVRNFEEHDWKGLYGLAQDYESSEYSKYDHGPWPIQADTYKDIVESWSKSDDFLAVTLRKSGKLIGLISKPTENHREYDFGFVFHSEFHGSGYATESCQAVIDHIFSELAADQILTGTAEMNKASVRLLVRLGFVAFHGEEDGLMSLRKDTDGNPIEFIGVSYKLTRKMWKKEKP